MAALEISDENRQLAATYRAPVPTIEEFIDGDLYLGLGGQCCSAVRETLLQVFNPDSEIRELALIWGIGAGKSWAIKLANAYIAYRFLCLRNPAEYYGIDPNGPATAIVNFSITAKQAHAVVFDSIAKTIDASPCFQRPGFRRDRKINSELRWHEHGLVIFPGNSQSESAIGYNVLAAVIDEANFLPDVESSLRVAGRTAGHHYDAAEELYNALIKRIKSRGNWRWQEDSLLATISSPRYVDDFQERQAIQAESNPRLYCSRLTTWEGAPKQHLCGVTFTDALLGQVPVEFQTEFLRDPERSRRDLGARPSLAIGGFFSDPSAIDAHCNHERQSPFDGAGALLPGFDGRGKPALHIHVDLGLKRDACGIAGTYSDGGKVVAAFYKRILPADMGGEIDFELVRKFITNLRDVHGWRIAKVTFDGWQSVDSRQMLAKSGIPTDELSVDRNTEAYDTLKELLLTDKLDYYEDEHLFGELRRLELIKGKKVDHPPGGSKDVADALAGAVYMASTNLSNTEWGAVETIPMPDPFDAPRGGTTRHWTEEDEDADTYEIPAYTQPTRF